MVGRQKGAEIKPKAERERAEGRRPGFSPGSWACLFCLANSIKSGLQNLLPRGLGEQNWGSENMLSGLAHGLFELPWVMVHHTPVPYTHRILALWLKDLWNGSLETGFPDWQSWDHQWPSLGLTVPRWK